VNAKILCTNFTTNADLCAIARAGYKVVRQSGKRRGADGIPVRAEPFTAKVRRVLFGQPWTDPDGPQAA